MFFHCEASRHGLILITPVFSVVLSFMRMSFTRDAVEIGWHIRYGLAKCEGQGYEIQYPHDYGAMWYIGRYALQALKNAIHFEVYP